MFKYNDNEFIKKLTTLSSRYMKIKNVEAVIPPNTPHFVGDGFRVHGFIPGKHP